MRTMGNIGTADAASRPSLLDARNSTSFSANFFAFLLQNPSRGGPTIS
jgi:hypothetical protein